MELNNTDMAVLAQLEKAVATMGSNHVYEKHPTTGVDEDGNEFAVNTCLYLNEEGNPDCIVGHALVGLGIGRQDISRLEGESAYAVLRELVPGITDDVAVAVNLCQASQDNGNSWGYAMGEMYHSLTENGLVPDTIETVKHMAEEMSTPQYKLV